MASIAARNGGSQSGTTLELSLVRPGTRATAGHPPTYPDAARQAPGLPRVCPGLVDRYNPDTR